MAAWRSYSSMDEEKIRRIPRTPGRLFSATSVMDERYRDSLQRHHSFLMTHMLLTDDVIQLMSSEKILPETMIRDIQDGDTQEEQNKRLLNALRLRGNKSYKRFRELMYRTGNFFVADLLWEEEEGPGGMLIDEEDLAVKFSAVMNCLHDTQRKKFLHYLDAKIREKALVLSWRERPGYRMESLSARVVDFNQERGLRDTIAAQERKIKDLEGQLKSEDDTQRVLRLELSSLQQQMKALKQDHLAQMATQSRFHDASMVTITRLKNKLSSCRSKAEGLNSQITSTLEGDLEKKKKKTAAGSGEEEEEEEETVNTVCELENNVHHLLQQYHYEKDQARNGRSQREEVLKMLNRATSRDSLVSVVKEVLKHEQKHRALVMRDIQRLRDTLRHVVPSSTLAPPTPIGVTPTELSMTAPPLDPATLDTKHFKNQLAMLKAEAEHIQKRFQWKDSEAANLRHELFAVKQRFHDYKIITSGSKPPQIMPAAAQLVCASCGKTMILQSSSGQGASLFSNSAQTAHSSTATQEKHGGVQVHAGDDYAEDMMPEGCDSRRGSIGRSDLDKTVVNVEEYLLDMDIQDLSKDPASPDKSVTQETMCLPEGDSSDLLPSGGAASAKYPPVKGAGETKPSGEAKSKRDAKSNTTWNKARVKRKLISK